MMGKIKKTSKIRKIAFWPAFILLFGSLVYSIVDKDGFMPWQTLPILGCWSILGGLTVLQASSVLPQLPSHTFLP